MTQQRRDAIFEIGDLLNNTYRIEAVLGRGGTSEVYRARSEISGHVVALKALRREFSGNDDFLTLMTREEAIREVRHDAIVRYFHNQRTADGTVFLIMDYVDGVGLDRKLKDGGMSAPDLLTVAARVAEGLATAHKRNITHRDLSPDNIILRGGDPAEAVIIDFGIAKDSNPGAETIVGNEFAGKYAYAAPEQLDGRADARSDIYALGALLLATFRGSAPDVGSNPLEVIRRKERPLDTEGVPEPLKTLIDRATAPDPDDRLQDAQEVLALARGSASDFDPEATVVFPRGAAQTAPPPRTEPSERRRVADARPKRAGVLALVLAVLAGLASAGAWFGGLLGPRLPTADPFTLTILRPADGVPSATGHAPSREVADTIAAHVAAAGGAADLTLARGDIHPDWGTGLGTLIDLLSPLDEYGLAIRDDDATVTGLTENRVLHDQLKEALGDPDIAPGLVIEAAIELGPRVLPTDRVRNVLRSHADCGELTLLEAPAQGFGQDGAIVVLGRVATPETRSAVRDALVEIAGARPVQVETEVLNPALCIVDSALPGAPAVGIDIAFSHGEDGAANPSGRFLVGENPVIDVTIPADINDGYLLVSVLDVSGNVFHLLPNVARPEHSVAALKNGQSGPVTLRVAWPLADSIASGGSKIAFEVDEETLGKSRVMVIHTAEDILDGLRPTVESAESFADALHQRSGPVRSLDSRILVTAAP